MKIADMFKFFGRSFFDSVNLFEDKTDALL